MTQNTDRYRTYVTQTGFGLEALANQQGTKVDFAKLVVGDGELPDSSNPANQTNLVNQVRHYPVTIEVDDKDPTIWVARAEIPAEDGGFTIREAGVKVTDENGDLYCYARQPGDYKPVLAEGSAKSYTIRLKFIPGNASVIEAKIDPSVQFATPTDLSNALKEHEDKSDPHPQYATDDDLQAHNDDPDPHSQYLPKSTYDQDSQSRTAELFKLPIYPECLTPDNKLSLDLTGTTLTVQEGQALRLRGWFDVSTADIDLVNRQFQIDVAKTYHLRYDRVNGFRLVDLSDVAYNPDAVNQKDARFDSTFDDVLLALIDQGQVTSYKNVADIAESQLGYMEITHSFLPSLNQVLFSVSVLNDYARSIDTRLVSEILFCNGSSNSSNYGFVVWKANEETLHSSKRFHAGTNSGYLYQDMVQADEGYRLLRETVEFTATLAERQGSPYLNPQFHSSWVNLPSSSYLKVEVD